MDFEQLKKEIVQKDGSFNVNHAHIVWMLGRIEELQEQLVEQQQENEQLKKNLSLLCPVADMPVIESLKAEKLHMMEQIAEQQREIERLGNLHDNLNNDLFSEKMTTDKLWFENESLKKRIDEQKQKNRTVKV